MSALTDALERILNWWRQHKPSYASSLQPGLTYEEIEEKVKNLPFRLPREVYELYQWRNGIIEEDSEFFYYQGFLPLEEALKLQPEISEYYNFSLPFAWFPIFYFEKVYVAVIGAEEDTESSLIIESFHSHDIAYTNLTNMMQFIAECYETDAYYLDENGHLHQNEIAAKNVLQKYEPEFNHVGEVRVELVDSLDGSQSVNTYHPNSNVILESRTTDAKGNLKEFIKYFNGKIVNRMTYNYEVEGFYEYICDENWFSDHEVHETFTVEYQYKCVASKIVRCYINGNLKNEIIYPDQKRDMTLLLFSFLILPIIRFLSLILGINNLFSSIKDKKNS